MNLDKIREIILPYLEENNISLYDIKELRAYGFNTLQILVDTKEGISIDTLALVNDYVSKQLDELDFGDSEYMLEVSSPGAEKELRNEEEVVNSIGKYIHIKTTDMIYEGYLLKFEAGILTIQINIKGRIKEINVDYADIKKIRLAVKI